MSKKGLRETLPGIWYRATEEETGAEKVFRAVGPDGQVPRGRNRELLTLNPDGTLIEGGIAPTDARTETLGRWELDGDRLTLYTPSASRSDPAVKTAKVSKDRILMKK